MSVPDQFSRDIARVGGEKFNRTFSHDTAIGFGEAWHSLTGRQLSSQTAQDVTHGLMLLDAVLMLQKETRPIGGVLALGLTGLFLAGKDCPPEREKLVF